MSKKNDEQGLNQQKSQGLKIPDNIAGQLPVIGRWSWNPETGAMSWSCEMYNIMRYEPTDVEPDLDAFIHMVHYDDREDVKKYLEKISGIVNSEDKERQVDHRVVCRDGTVRFVREYIETCRRNAENQFVISAIILDYTNSIRLNEQIEKMKKEEQELSRLRQAFQTSILNDIRMPLTTMHSLLMSITASESTSIKEKHHGVLQELIDSGEGLLKSLDKILSQGNGARIIPVNRFFDARNVTLRAIGIYGTIADEKGVSIVNEVLPGSRLFGDFDLILSVLCIIISNAVKHCRESSTIQVYIPHDQPTSIAVKDAGSGIGRTRMPDLFKHGKNRSTTSLAYCMEVMKAHNGSVAVDSIKGAGSVFYLHFPYKRPKVLIVDDDPTELLLLGEYLKKIDVEVLEAENGVEALKIVDNENPSLVITDVHMPLLNGISLLEKLKNNPLTASVPVVVMTADHLMETRDKVFQLGADDFIHKLIITEDFIPRIRRFIV